MKNQSKNQNIETLENALRQNNEMREYIKELTEDQERINREMMYLYGYISYKGLDEDYRYFRDHAYEKRIDDRPFPILTL